MKKALLLTEVFPPRKGGSGRWLYELYRRLPAGCAHAVAPDEEGWQEVDRGHGLPVTRLPFRLRSWGVLDRPGLVDHLRTFWRLRRLVARVRPDVVHAGKALPEGLLAWLLKAWCGLPYVCYAHGEELLLARTSKELSWLTRRALRGARLVVANSAHTRGLLQRDWGLAAARVAVMHPGVDTAQFVPAPPDEAARRALGWQGRAVVLTVGQLQKRKGQDMMVRALPAVRHEVPNVLFVMIGGGPDREYIEALVREAGVAECVQFRGAADDAEMIRCYQQCDLFALPNRQVGWDFEGFGIVLLEAQACGKPVLAGASGGTAETMRPGVTGVVVPCEEPGPLAEAVAGLLRDGPRRAQMGAAGREWVVGRLDWAPLARQAVELFDIR